MARMKVRLVVSSLACLILLGGCDHTVKIKTDEATRQTLEKSTENIGNTGNKLDPFKTGRLLDQVEERDRKIEKLQTENATLKASMASQRDAYSVVIPPKEYVLAYDLVKGDGDINRYGPKVMASVEVKQSETEVTLRIASDLFQCTKDGKKATWPDANVGLAKVEDQIFKAPSGYRVVKVENTTGAAEVQHDQNSHSSQLSSSREQMKGCVSEFFSQGRTKSRDLPTIDPEKKRSSAERAQAIKDAMGNEGRAYSKLTTSGIVVYLERVR